MNPVGPQLACQDNWPDNYRLTTFKLATTSHLDVDEAVHKAVKAMHGRLKYGVYEGCKR